MGGGFRGDPFGDAGIPRRVPSLKTLSVDNNNGSSAPMTNDPSYNATIRSEQASARVPLNQTCPSGSGTTDKSLFDPKFSTLLLSLLVSQAVVQPMLLLILIVVLLVRRH